MTTLQGSSEVVRQTIGAVPARRPQIRHSTQRVLRLIGTWMERSGQRRALADLDDRLLQDVGIARSEAAREIAKPFWR
jgi:uncharacterized protein YjiS (DUF1127 family)